MDPENITIAYIGGGSRNWALKLMADLALEREIGGELRLYDIDGKAALHNEGLGRALFSRPESGGRFRVRAVDTAAGALGGADFVVMSIEPGPIEARKGDLVVPLEHGILQTVGDTVGPGGLLRALRALPVMADYATLVMELCPDAWVINYTNPMSLCLAAMYEAAPGLRAYGCCHEVFSIQKKLADLIARADSVPAPPRSEIDLEFAGLNHFTLATRASWKGRDLMALVREEARTMEPRRDRSARALDRRSREAWFESDGAIAYDLLSVLGVLGAAGDRHLAEFLPFYFGSEATILSYGVPPTPFEWRLREWTRPRPAAARIAARPVLPSGEEGVAQMKALAGLGSLRTNLNLPNHGQWTQVPELAIVETMALIEGEGISPIKAPNLPQAALEFERRALAVQALTLEAAKTRDPDLALQALLLDPLVRLPPARAEALLRDMLAEAAPWLPGWRIPGQGRTRARSP